MIDGSDVQALYLRWQAWDRRPFDSFCAHRLEDEVQRVAAQLGITGSELRDRVGEWRIDGLSLRDALQSVLSDFGG